ncbi:hypothetical protein BKA82DRAFT_2596190 [Pisolithus tinctorius]|nr:hypothetical protein BKA82DRAFT_2596190 [Pisolithus tinctorius]
MDLCRCTVGCLEVGSSLMRQGMRVSFITSLRRVTRQRVRVTCSSQRRRYHNRLFPKHNRKRHWAAIKLIDVRNLFSSSSASSTSCSSIASPFLYIAISHFDFKLRNTSRRSQYLSRERSIDPQSVSPICHGAFGYGSASQNVPQRLHFHRCYHSEIQTSTPIVCSP